MPLNIFNQFVSNNRVIEDSVPLFATDANGFVKIKPVGRDQRPVLSRSPQMEELVINQVDLMLADGGVNLDGLIYMMFHKDGDQIIPLYIGKAETTGRANPISANVVNLRSDKHKFARWGDGYQYHIGDLSAVTLPGHNEKHATAKYLDWANTLFDTVPTSTPRLKKPVYFWCKAWDRKGKGIWANLPETRLTFLEYLMIGIASDAFPDLLNREGHNRK